MQHELKLRSKKLWSISMGKIHTVVLPDIGEGVVEGEVIEWLKKEGDSLSQDEPVVIVMTDKATVELPAPYPGKLAKQYFQAGETAIKDKPLYDIELELDHESLSSKKTEEKEKKVEEKPPKHPVKSTEKIFLEESEGVKALPSVRKLAADLRIDLSLVSPSGKDGRITEEDLSQFIQKRTLVKDPKIALEMPEDQILPHKGIKGLMAKKMSESKKNVPHFSFFEQLNAERLIKLRENFKNEGLRQSIEVTFMPFLMRALSLTILKFPEINSSYDEEKQQLFLHKTQNIGFATSSPQGLIVPVLKSVQNLPLVELIKQYAELKQKAVENKLQSNDLKGGTITLSNFGVVPKGGGLWATPIINYPEVAILAVARIQKQPLVKNDEIVIKPLLNLSWSFDHRVIDGDTAAHCSNYFAQLLENPASLL